MLGKAEFHLEVTEVHADIKNGQPGVVGWQLDRNTGARLTEKWAYNSQIVEIDGRSV